MHFVEVVPNSSSSTAPGWAYVPDTGYDPTKAKLQPTGRKRNARVAGLSGVDTTARQNAAIAKRLAELDKDHSRDANIAVPSKQKDTGGRVSKGKTPATRKILLAQKTFANYLADEEAFAAQEAQNIPGPRSKAATLQRQVSVKASETPAPAPEPEEKEKGHTTTVTQTQQTGPAHLATNDRRLLQVHVPSAPSEALMETLITAPALSFNAARAAPSETKRPPRVFCELCGYWGQIKCIYCGARVCGLDCKQAHDEDRCLKYSV